MPEGAYAAGLRFRERAKQAMAELVPKGTLLVLPTAPAPTTPIFI